jgi:hypothetical protein
MDIGSVYEMDVEDILGSDCIEVFLSSSKEGFGIRHNARTQTCSEKCLPRKGVGPE